MYFIEARYPLAPNQSSLINKETDTKTTSKNFPANSIGISVHQFCHCIYAEKNKTAIPENIRTIQVVDQLQYCQKDN